MSADVHNRETVDAELVRLAIVAAEPVIWNAVAVVAATLLPGAVLGLPTMGTIPLPSDPLLAFLVRAPLFCGPVVLLLPLLALLILLPPGLLSLVRGVVLLLPLLALLILLPSGLLSLVRGVVLLLPLLLSLSLLLLTLLLLRGLSLLLPFRLSLLLSLFGLALFFLFVLPCAGLNSPSEKQKHSGCNNDPKRFQHFIYLH